MGKSVMDDHFIKFLDNEPDAIYWYRAFLEADADKKSFNLNVQEFFSECMRALMWIGNMLGHTGTLSSQFFTNGKSKDHIGRIFMPKEWLRKVQAVNSEEERKRKDDEVADSLRGL